MCHIWVRLGRCRLLSSEDPVYLASLPLTHSLNYTVQNNVPFGQKSELKSIVFLTFPVVPEVSVKTDHVHLQISNPLSAVNYIKSDDILKVNLLYLNLTA